VNDEVPPGRDGKQSLPEADLDAALWPDSAAAPSLAPPTPVAVSPSATSKAPLTQARDRLRRERERQARRRRRTRWSVAGAAVLVIVAAAVVGTVILRYGHTPRKVELGYTGPFAPVTLNVDNSVTMAQPGVTSPVIDVYEDFQCPGCRTFENTNGAMLQRLADQGKVKVVYYPFTVFSGQPEQANSVRAWAAARCAPPSRWAKYHNALYANQPAETAAHGFSVGMLVWLGRKVGITSPAFAQCVRSQEYAVQNAPLSDQIMNGGVSRLPALTLNGRALHISPTSPGLRKQILSQPYSELNS
jgi:protein-disulfide isomerase